MNQDSSDQVEPRWQPIGRDERRVLGVLGEKAKTTAESYALTLNSLTNGCNQKNNRYPKLDLEPIDVQNAIEKLSPLGAVSEFVSGRVEKYRHHINDWMGVSAVESAVMAELLLRGAQSVGDLRGRANRMSAIAGVSELRPLVYSLMQRNLVVPLTESGRGQVVTHNLYADPKELSDLRDEFNGGRIVNVNDQPQPGGASLPLDSAELVQHPDHSLNTCSPTPVPAVAPIALVSPAGDEVAKLREEVAEMKLEFQKVRREIEDLWANIK